MVRCVKVSMNASAACNLYALLCRADLAAAVFILVRFKVGNWQLRQFGEFVDFFPVRLRQPRIY